MEETLKDIHAEYIKERMHETIESLENIDSIIIMAGLQNEQFVLDFYDRLNEISVRR